MSRSFLLIVPVKNICRPAGLFLCLSKFYRVKEIWATGILSVLLRVVIALLYFLITFAIMAVSILLIYRAACFLGLEVDRWALVLCAVMAVGVNFASIYLSNILTLDHLMVVIALVLVSATLVTIVNEYLLRRHAPVLVGVEGALSEASLFVREEEGRGAEDASVALLPAALAEAPCRSGGEKESERRSAGKTMRRRKRKTSHSEAVAEVFVGGVTARDGFVLGPDAAISPATGQGDERATSPGKPADLPLPGAGESARVPPPAPVAAASAPQHGEDVVPEKSEMGVAVEKAVPIARSTPAEGIVGDVATIVETASPVLLLPRAAAPPPEAPIVKESGSAAAGGAAASPIPEILRPVRIAGKSRSPKGQYGGKRRSPVRGQTGAGVPGTGKRAMSKWTPPEAVAGRKPGAPLKTPPIGVELARLHTLDDYVEYAFQKRAEGCLSTAVLAYQQALGKFRDDPYTPFIIMELGNIYKETGDYAEAVSAYHSALRLDAVKEYGGMAEAFQKNIAYLDTVLQILTRRRIPNTPFSQIPPDCRSEIESAFAARWSEKYQRTGGTSK